MADTLSLIRARQKAISLELAELQAQMRDLELEAERLTNAEAVVRSLANDSTLGQLVIDRAEDRSVRLEAAIAKGKPEDAPSVPAMIMEALQVAHESGSPGLPPVSITLYIKGKYWPTVEVVNVGPIAWRMWKRGQVGKDGAIYYLNDRDSRYPVPKNEKASDEGTPKAFMNGANGENHSGGIFG